MDMSIKTGFFQLFLAGFTKTRLDFWERYFVDIRTFPLTSLYNENTGPPLSGKAGAVYAVLKPSLFQTLKLTAVSPWASTPNS